GKRCDTWSYVLIPTTQPGQFTVDHGEPGSDKEDTQVMDTDYTRFALMLSLRQVSRQTVIRVSLLGRSWSLPPRTLDKFFCLARAQGLTKKNIMFPDMTGNGFTGSGQWEMEMGPGGRFHRPSQAWCHLVSQSPLPTLGPLSWDPPCHPGALLTGDRGSSRELLGLRQPVQHWRAPERQG
uniref:Epididymal-specific lipocalin-12-like n=1 Tax=Castor canadensis TaxID=51338 RepID=A0A8B7TP50_CASCN